MHHVWSTYLWTVARMTTGRRGFVGVIGVLVVLVASVTIWLADAWADRDDRDPAVPSPASSTTITTTLEPTTTTTSPRPAGADGSLEHGESGPEVEALQERLAAVGYWHGQSDGDYGQLTRQAVMAFQKAEGLARDGIAGPGTQAAVAAAERPAPHEPDGDHVEIDLARQILLVVEGGQTRWVLNTSTGNGEAYPSPSGGTSVATTPTGRFAVEREIDGVRHAPLGDLYRPKYFVGGIAIHGAGQIPATPASHGCASGDQRRDGPPLVVGRRLDRHPGTGPLTQAHRRDEDGASTRRPP